VPRLSVTATVVIAVYATLNGQPSAGPPKGTLIVDGGGTTNLVKDRFVAIAGGKSARIVVLPTGASSIRFGPQNVILNPDWPRDRPEWSAYEFDLKAWFGVASVTVLHTRDRAIADSETFVTGLRTATGVFLGTGNAGRIADAYLGTRTQVELQALLDRGGAIFGSSSGAIVMGSFIVRGWTAKPLLMAPGHDRGFAFLKNVAINPHLTESKRDYELINVVDAHPEILGVGIDEPAALVVQGNRFEVIGAGRVAIYDNHPHPGTWYYWLKPGDRFDLGTWQKLVP
jgi:cyanophycinase